jgi:hypothetical protein
MSRKFPPLKRAAAWKPTGEDLTWLLAEFVELSASVEIDRCTSAEERAGLKTDRERAAKILEAIRPMLFPA